MGTGKTTVGRLLAQRLDREFVDTDAIIERRHGSIASIFADRGEAAFRAIERAVAAELAEREALVIATGGRLMLDPANEATLGATGHVFCLTAEPAIVLARVLADAERVERPLLAVDDPHRRVVELLDERSPGYARFRQVDTAERPPTAVADEILRLVGDDIDID